MVVPCPGLETMVKLLPEDVGKDKEFLDWVNLLRETFDHSRINTSALNPPAPARFFEQAGVGLSDGKDFQGPGYVRLNFGCPRQTLLEGLERIKSAVANV